MKFTYVSFILASWCCSVTVSADLVITSADTLDLTLAGGAASFTAGEIRVFAVLQDVSDIGEMEADEVDRDQLA